MTLLLIVLASLASGLPAVLLAATLLFVHLERAMPRLLSYSTGTLLLGSALLGMVPRLANLCCGWIEIIASSTTSHGERYE